MKSRTPYRLEVYKGGAYWGIQWRISRGDRRITSGLTSIGKVGELISMFLLLNREAA